MELGNGKVNKFFTPPAEGQDRYYIDSFDGTENSYNNYVAILMEHVKNKSVILDVGCAQGRFGKSLAHKNCTIYGIERDKTAAKHAVESGYYKDVFIYDVCQTLGNEYERLVHTVSNVDVIILTDVLEHFEDPTKIIVQLYGLMKSDGIMLISVPNISHADVILNLMNGVFNYSDMGILDNTHLKWFTKQSFFQWIAQINDSFSDVAFDCEYLGGICYYNKFLNEIKAKHSTLYNIIGMRPEFNALQILFKLKKLKIGENAVYLQAELSEETIKVVEALSNALEGNLVWENEKMPKMLLSERMWHERYLDYLEGEVKKLSGNLFNSSERVEALLQYVSQLEAKNKELSTKAEKVDQLFSEQRFELQCKQNQSEEAVAYIAQLEERLQVLENEKGILLLKNGEYQKELKIAKETQGSLKEELLDLREKIFYIESSFSWKITKILR